MCTRVSSKKPQPDINSSAYGCATCTRLETEDRGTLPPKTSSPQSFFLPLAFSTVFGDNLWWSGCRPSEPLPRGQGGNGTENLFFAWRSFRCLLHLVRSDLGKKDYMRPMLPIFLIFLKEVFIKFFTSFKSI